jgi:hypothetical protein
MTQFVQFSKSLQGDAPLFFDMQRRVKTILLSLSVLMRDDHLDAVTCIAGVIVECHRVDPFQTIVEGTKTSVSQGLFDVIAASGMELNMTNQVPFVAFHSSEALCPRLSNQQHYVCSFNQAAVIPVLLFQAADPSLPPCEIYLEGSVMLRRVTDMPQICSIWHFNHGFHKCCDIESKPVIS